MLVNKYIYAKLTAAAGVTALVSTRVYPVSVPQGEGTNLYPAIVYSDSYSPADNSKSEDATHDNCVLTVTSWAASYDDAAAIDVAVRAALDYQDGLGAGATAGGVTVDVCEWQNSIPGREEGNSAPGGGPYFFRESTYQIRERR
jgi:hypothetical protein